MISKTMEAALNAQIKEEFFSMYLYISMSVHFREAELPGIAHWLSVQASEEHHHANKLMHYLIDRGGKVVLEQLDKPKSGWASPLDAFEDALKHEEHITHCINKLVSQAHSEHDYATSTMLNWFVREQVEEELNASSIARTLKLYVKDSGEALLFLDKQLGKRERTAARV